MERNVKGATGLMHGLWMTGVIWFVGYVIYKIVKEVIL